MSVGQSVGQSVNDLSLRAVKTAYIKLLLRNVGIHFQRARASTDEVDVIVISSDAKSTLIT